MTSDYVRPEHPRYPDQQQHAYLMGAVDALDSIRQQLDGDNTAATDACRRGMAELRERCMAAAEKLDRS